MILEALSRGCIVATDYQVSTDAMIVLIDGARRPDAYDELLDLRLKGKVKAVGRVVRPLRYMCPIQLPVVYGAA